MAAKEELAIVVPPQTMEQQSVAPPDGPPDFDGLVAEHEGRVRRLAQRLLGWSGDVEDVVQDVFLAAYRKLPRFRNEGGAGAWLARLTINACRSRHRRRFLF
ncbi:MAG TPA: RNA polymerase sigma factor, partial [Planctomycetia bacterium]|nr:RNA polymerase sigma factor [Planctomycetia bacterium]